MKSFLQPADFVAKYGTAFSPWPLQDSLAYTKFLALEHYENFQVASYLLPHPLRQDFFNIYAFCRWADDLGDEIGNDKHSLELLGWWRKELTSLYLGQTMHPVYVALESTVRRHGIPEKPFSDLIQAFVQDQTVKYYATYNELLNYCRCSANPVGHIVLHLCGYKDEAHRHLSDFTCTALQLTNFWQDIAHDRAIGRLYIPLDRMRAFNYSPAMLDEDLEHGRGRTEFRNLMRNLVEETEQSFKKGLPLACNLDYRLSVQLELFSRGGLAVLGLIRGQSYDTIQCRPKLNAAKHLKLLLNVALRRLVQH